MDGKTVFTHNMNSELTSSQQSVNNSTLEAEPSEEMLDASCIPVDEKFTCTFSNESDNNDFESIRKHSLGINSVNDKTNATENELGEKILNTPGIIGDEMSESSFPCEKDNLNLESVQQYAGRIKSFLGWEDDDSKVTPETALESETAFNKCAADSVDESPIFEGQDDAVQTEDRDSKSEKESIENSNFGQSSRENDLNTPERESSLCDNSDEMLETSLELEEKGKEDYSPKIQDESLNCNLDIPESQINDEEYVCEPSLRNNTINERCLIETITETNCVDETTKAIPNNGSVEYNSQLGEQLPADISQNNLKDSGDHRLQEVNNGSANIGEDTSNCETFEGINNLEEDILNKNKKYFLDVRRFSKEIVKDVIKSARNSIIEMHHNDDKLPSIDDNLRGSFESEIKQSVEMNKCHETSSDYLETCEELDSVLKTSEMNIMKDSSFLTDATRIENERTDSKDNVSTKKDNACGNLYVEEEIICGFCCFRPEWIQRCATTEMYLFLYCIIGILLGIFSTYFIATFSTLERRFAFKTKISGAILVVDEVIPLFLGIFVGYFGGKAHRPRLIAFGMMMSAACSFLTSLPYFIYGPAQHLTFVNSANKTGPELCDTQMIEDSCNEHGRPPTLSAVLLLLFASSMKGFGNLAFFAVGLPYLDDNAKKRNSPLYIAIALALRLLGPLVGFLMSSAFLKLYENPFVDPGFGPEDPRWIGAWWMGFCLQGILLLVFTLPIAMFPRRLPSQSKLIQSTSIKKETFRELFVGLFAALKRLAKNPLFVFININTTMAVFGHFGHYIMLPKYMENQFRLSASDASLLSGPPAIACIMVSTVFGGFIIWKYRPTAKLLLTGMLAGELVLAVGYLTLTIPRCQSTEMSHFGMNDEGLILDSICNKNCDCSTTAFTPFCDPVGKKVYFSPCYAGCTIERNASLSTTKESKVFENCSCVSDPNGQRGADLSEGFCPDENCWSQTLAYIIILLILHTINSTLTVGHTMILLRSVLPEDKSVALGTFETLICLFGFIPFPVTFGALVDSACLIWEKSCGETGNCWFYDMEKYNYLLHGASSLFCILSTLCILVMYFFSARVRNLYAEEDEEMDFDKPIKLDTVSGTVTKL